MGSKLHFNKALKTIISCLLVALSFAAMANTNNEQLAHCQQIDVDSKRLRCYDAIVTDRRTNAINPPVVLHSKLINVDQEKQSRAALPKRKSARVSKTGAFGGDHLKAKDKDALKQVELTVKSVSKSRTGIITFVFENGQIWRQKSATSVFMSKKKVHKAVIKSGALGSFNMRINNKGRSFKVKRIK